MGREPDRIFDEYLVVLARTGSRPALTRLVMRWSPRLQGYAARVLGDAEAARDVVQETWAAVVAGLGRLEDPARFRAWLFGIATRRCADAQRSAVRVRRLRAVVASEALLAVPAVAAPGERLDLAAAIARLPDDQRAAVALFYGAGLGVGEIAGALGVAPGTVKSRLFAARRALAEFMEGGSS
ncbi:RNA polymerase sigma factor [Phenylobacterium terrae]|uniref:RNA polymerase sigma factor n=1 Tax=Phenylobacterium terrae TaxID=2665495 RepID=A0ABW4MWY0_9CAUL